MIRGALLLSAGFGLGYYARGVSEMPEAQEFGRALKKRVAETVDNVGDIDNIGDVTDETPEGETAP